MKLYCRLIFAFAAAWILVFITYSKTDFRMRAPVYSLHSKNHPIVSPVCDNALVNITRGRWVKKVDLVEYKDKLDSIAQYEEELVKDLKEYWVNNGIQSTPWSEDMHCGYKNYQPQPPKSQWPKVGSRCDPESEKPCCSNAIKGSCMPPSESNCNCSGCIDVRRYKHAETSDWIVDDDRCKWRSYNAQQICDVIERSPFEDIHYVGDSFARKMFRTLSIMITDDFENGWTTANTSSDLRNRCKGMQTYYWRHCIVQFRDIRQVFNPDKLCGGRGYMNFTVQLHGYYSTKFKTQFLNLVKSKLGVHGSLIVLSTGYHMSCSSKTVINKFLGPAIDLISKRYGPPKTGNKNHTRLSGRWPQIVLCLPPTIGLLKPAQHLHMQSQTKCDQYSSDMQTYAEDHGIKILDVRPISKFIHSFDGSHYSFAVNKMKNYVLLNYIASLKDDD